MSGKYEIRDGFVINPQGHRIDRGGISERVAVVSELNNILEINERIAESDRANSERLMNAREEIAELKALAQPEGASLMTESEIEQISKDWLVTFGKLFRETRYLRALLVEAQAALKDIRHDDAIDCCRRIVEDCKMPVNEQTLVADAARAWAQRSKRNAELDGEARDAMASVRAIRDAYPGDQIERLSKRVAVLEIALKPFAGTKTDRGIPICTFSLMDIANAAEAMKP